MSKGMLSPDSDGQLISAARPECRHCLVQAYESSAGSKRWPADLPSCCAQVHTAGARGSEIAALCGLCCSGLRTS